MLAERKDLNHWLKVKKQADKQIEQFTTDPVTHKKYATLFRKELERRIIRKSNKKMCSYEVYATYQRLRKRVHEHFGYDTAMMTKTEYEEAIKIIEELGYEGVTI